MLPSTLVKISHHQTPGLNTYGHYGGDFGRSALTALCTGLVSGSCFYFCFLTAEKDVGISPFWTTALCHVLFNGTVLGVFGLAYVLGFLS
ncbi:hypothetical protein [Gluconobacter oxydans]|uniref:Uncharacterized protein n=1 Tax=Gluconobacter oxydans TaxID=442 RepID=A0AB35ANV0_GLUOY|nr:hypothetical protein [Gluconobacter oxydans]MBF0855686.1 hypothetical protein [Gluconobacter oxydans]TCW28109.1 hypothetical protein EDC20_104157 [Gluconobacter oxydans]